MTLKDTSTYSARISYDGDEGTSNDEPITQVQLRNDEYGGPFWNDEGCLGDDWDIWEPMGLTGETYNACMRWTGDQDEKNRLLRLLRAELSNEVSVESPTT